MSLPKSALWRELFEILRNFFTKRLCGFTAISTYIHNLCYEVTISHQKLFWRAKRKIFIGTFWIRGHHS